MILASPITDWQLGFRPCDNYYVTALMQFDVSHVEQGLKYNQNKKISVTINAAVKALPYRLCNPSGSCINLQGDKGLIPQFQAS